jgi:uncharacterized protein (DUF1697 family)
MSAKAKTYVALLRGINLGARNRVAMKDLRALVEGLGGEDVRTYLQSGNVVFGASDLPADPAKALEASIRKSLGLDVTVLARTKAELDQIVRRNPFDGADPASLHVTFLADTPAKSGVTDLGEKTFEPDAFDVAVREVYLHCPDGYGRSKLSNAFFEKRLGVRATTRNWKTVTALAELANA